MENESHSPSVISGSHRDLPPDMPDIYGFRPSLKNLEKEDLTADSV